MKPNIDEVNPASEAEGFKNAARMIARKLWVRNYREQFPDATQEDIKNAWGEVRKNQVKEARRILRHLDSIGALNTDALNAA